MPSNPADQTPNPNPKSFKDQANGNEVANSKSVFGRVSMNVRAHVSAFFGSRLSRFRAVTYGGIAAFFCAWGAFYYNNRHAPPWLPVVLFSIGGIFGAFSARQVAINNHKSDLIANIWFGIVICTVIGLSVLDLWFEYFPQTKRHLTLYVHTGDSPAVNLHLTNSVLLSKMGKDGFQFPTNLPFLVIEVAKSDPQFTLKLGVLNDSAPRFSPPLFSVEKPEINIWIADSDPGETLKWMADSKWQEVFANGRMTNGASIKFPGRVLQYQFPASLPPGTGDSAPGLIFNMQEKPSSVMIAVLTSGKDVLPKLYFFKLLAVPSDENASKMRFDTNSLIWWTWKYRPVAYRPIDTPIVVSPNRVQLSDGKSLFGKKVEISNPSSSNLYAITLSVEIEGGTVPIGSPLIELSQPRERKQAQGGELRVMFEAAMDFIGYSQSRLFIIPVLESHEDRSFWIRGTTLTNSFANISVWQSLNSFPDVKYTSNGLWMWPVLSSNSAFWMHTRAQPMDLDFGIMAWRGTNGFTNDSQIIPSHP